MDEVQKNHIILEINKGHEMAANIGMMVCAVVVANVLNDLNC